MSRVSKLPLDQWDPELRRQRAAYRRGVARSAGVFGVALAAVVSGVVAVNQYQRARFHANRARSAVLRESAERELRQHEHQAWR